VGLAVVQGNKNPFKGRQFTAEIILWAVLWYLQFPISYRRHYQPNAAFPLQLRFCVRF
jgi:hypothetical protein